MRARTLVYWLMVISPVGFIAWMAIIGRFAADDFEFTACSLMQEEAINSYIKPVQELEPMLRVSARRASKEQLVRASDIWRTRVEEAKLDFLTPAEYGATIRDGVTSDIYRTCLKVCDFRMELARRSQAEGKPEETVGWLLKAHRSFDTIKYSDCASVSLVSVRQREIVRLIGATAAKLPAEASRTTARQLESLREDPEQFEAVQRHREVLFNSYQRSQEAPLTTEQGPGEIIALASAKPRGESSRALQEVRLARKSLENLKGETQKLCAALLSKASPARASKQASRR